MDCPSCNSEMELCERPGCKDAPHWICGSFFGCVVSFKADKHEIEQFRWPKGADEASSEETENLIAQNTERNKNRSRQ